MPPIAYRHGICSSAVAAVLALASASPAGAQETGDAPPPQADEAAPPAVASADAATTGERLVYTPEDFARYAPRSALDMLQQVPGFNIESEGNRGGQARGLGQL